MQDEDWEEVDEDEDGEDEKQRQVPSQLLSQGKDASVFKALEGLEHLLYDEVRVPTWWHNSDIIVVMQTS